MARRFTAREWSELADQKRRNKLEQDDPEAWRRENAERLLKAEDKYRQGRREQREQA